MKFLNNVEVLTPTNNAHAATKKYVDDNAGTGSGDDYGGRFAWQYDLVSDSLDLVVIEDEQ